MEVLKKRWISANNKLMVKIQEKKFDTLWYKPLVIISNPKSIVNVKYAPREIKNHVVRVDQLLNYIKNDINNYDRDLLSFCFMFIKERDKIMRNIFIMIK